MTGEGFGLTGPVARDAITYMWRALEPKQTFAYTDYRILKDATTKLMVDISNSTGHSGFASQTELQKTLGRINADIAETLDNGDKALASARQDGAPALLDSLSSLSSKSSLII